MCWALPHIQIGSMLSGNDWSIGGVALWQSDLMSLMGCVSNQLICIFVESYMF